MMSFEVEETGAVPSAMWDHLVRYDKRQKTYALVIPNDPAGHAIPISYCPWCSTKLPRVRAVGLTKMTPDTCRTGRKALSMTPRQLADSIGESLETVYRYEMGKPTQDTIVEKLLSFFQEHQIPGRRPGGSRNCQP